MGDIIDIIKDRGIIGRILHAPRDVAILLKRIAILESQIRLFGNVVLQKNKEMSDLRKLMSAYRKSTMVKDDEQALE